MNTTKTSLPIMELGSTYVRLAIFSNLIPNQNLYFEEKFDFTRDAQDVNQKIFNLITNAEKKLGNHLNEILMLIDSSSVNSLDYTIQKNYDKKLIEENETVIVIQINGKRKTEISVASDLTEEALKELVLEESIIKNALRNSDLKRFIYVPKRIINLVI